MDIISSDNEAFRSYAFWTGVLVLKVLAMSALTGLTRFKTKTFANPEDTVLLKVKVKFGDENVERFRRAHRNDLENVLPLITIGFFYLLTNPPVALAIALYKAAAILRIAHTIVYALYVLPQPARVIAWGIPYAISGYMAYKTVLHFV